MTSKPERMGESPVLDLGGITIEWLDNGLFHLDGGSMFGVVPKALWARKYPVDYDNMIPLAASPLLVKTPEHRLVIDSGLGNKLTSKQQKIWGVEYSERLDQTLRQHGEDPAGIDYLVLTHFHFDHGGGVTVKTADGDIEPVLPGARYVMQKREWEEVQHPNIRSRNTYWRENWEALDQAGLVEPVEGDVELVPGITLHHTGGHSGGHQLVEINGQEQTALHFGDLMPHHGHLNPLWVLAFDDYPMDSVFAKEEWVQRATSEGWWLTFYHDPFIVAGRWDQEGECLDKLQVRPVGPLPSRYADS